MQTITKLLTFKDNGNQAIEFYASIFNGAVINNLMVNPETDALLHASFSLIGHESMAMDGGEYFSFAQVTSLFISCHSQDEVDYYWSKLIAD